MMKPSQIKVGMILKTSGHEVITVTDVADLGMEVPQFFAKVNGHATGDLSLDNEVYFYAVSDVDEICASMPKSKIQQHLF